MTLNDLCEHGQRLLIETRYLDAIETLLQAEALAMAADDFDALSRLYMPLQEARRQVRQRCSEGVVRMDILPADATGPDPVELLSIYPKGQLLIAGWGTCEPATRFRDLAWRSKQYVETFLAAAFPIVGGSVAVAIVPTADVSLPSPQPRSVDALLAALPAHSRLFNAADLPPGERPGTSMTFDAVSDIWETLHLPFLAAADQEPDARRKIAAYRRTIDVDAGCELAHQRLSATARELSRSTGNSGV